ncbi:hypothetical protein CDAR_499961 [Caerostris darwini]|uniref:Uncharacterized protein n=1 Tax=Caerostris darwini TaxID=1538125 RepID=A0AAV4MX62_9ARAC|nr:hypothetical protein CDAR_499961 [Caerostris darwini]
MRKKNKRKRKPPNPDENRSEEKWCRSAKTARRVAEKGHETKCHPLAKIKRKNKRKVPLERGKNTPKHIQKSAKWENKRGRNGKRKKKGTEKNPNTANKQQQTTKQKHPKKSKKRPTNKNKKKTPTTIQKYRGRPHKCRRGPPQVQKKTSANVEEDLTSVEEDP